MATTLTCLSALIILLFGTTQGRADSRPPGCTGSGLGITLFTDAPDIHIGDTLNYSILVFNGTGVGPVVCDATGITASLTTPDGVLHPITLVRTNLSNGQSDFYSNVVSYVARAQDVRPDDTLRATAQDRATIHQNDTDSNGGADQGVNTEVSKPCIRLTAQCVGSTGENGSISFTGMVFNCGNNPLSGVTVSNVVDGTAVLVFGPVNLTSNQTVSFSGSYVPTNSCGPTTATLTASGRDAATASPQLVTSVVPITCSVTTSPGIVVTKVCPVVAPFPGQTLTYSGTVSNTGNITLTNVLVTDSQTGSTPVFTLASLAPGASANFTGSYIAPTNCSVTDTLTASAGSRCNVPVANSVTTTCPIATTPVILVTAVCSSIPLSPGGTATYSGTVSNAGNVTLTNVTVISDRPSSNTTVFSLATLAVGASANFTGSYTVPGGISCSVTANLTAGGKNACNGTGVTNSTSATCAVTTAPGIAVTLNCPTTPVNGGSNVTYTGSVRNSGNVTLNNVVVRDDDAVPSPVVLTIATLAPGVSSNFTASFTTPVAACSVSSTVSASGSDACTSVVVTNSASATCPYTTTGTIVVTQNCPSIPTAPGGTLTYSGTVSNAGSVTLTNVLVTNSRTGTTPVFTAPTLAAGATVNFTGSYVVPTNSGCSVTSVATATGVNACNGAVATSSFSSTCPISGSPIIAVTLNCPTTPVATGASITYTGTVKNPGNVTLNNIVVVNNQASPSTVFTLASLAPGATANFSATFVTPTNTCSVTSTVTASATNSCAAGSVSDTASATCQLTTSPSLIVRQSCPTIAPSAGGLLTYSGSVNNSGNITLTNVVVVNDRSGPSPVFTVATLAPGATTNFTGSYIAPSSGCSVTATLTATANNTCNGNAVTNVNSTTCPIATTPVIAVSLACPVAPASPGGPVTYTGTVSNPGDVTLNNVTVASSQPSPTTVLTLASLAPGASTNFTATFTAPLSGCSVSAAVVARGTSACTSLVVSNTASATCPLGTAPGIVVRQNCPASVTSPGGVLSYSGSVSNSGNISLTNIVVTNDRTGATPVFTVASLAPHAIANFTGSYTAPAGVCSVTSTTTATGRDACSGITVADSTSSTCPVAGTPGITVSQTCPPGATAPGGTLTYSGTVSNSGNVVLTNVVVVSDRPNTNTVVFSVASLAPGASANFTGSYTAHTNCCTDTSTVKATGANPCNGVVVAAAATRTCPILSSPGIVVTRVCSTNTTGPGQVLQFSGTVRNTGDISLTNVTVVHSTPTNNTRVLGPITLAPGQTVSYTGSNTVPVDFCGTDTVTARGVSICDVAVTNSTTTTCPITYTPSIKVTKNCPATPPPLGGVFTYTGTVKNTGNGTLVNVFVVSSVPNPNTPILGPITLAPGASSNFTATFTAPSDCCDVPSTVAARGDDRCSGVTVTDEVSDVCPLKTNPRITVTKNCPTGTIAVGQAFNYSGTVSNSGDGVLTNVFVVSSLPAANTPVLGPIELAPGESQQFTGSYIVTAGVNPAAGTVTARGLSVCHSVSVAASASCSGTINPPPPTTNAVRFAKGTYNGLFAVTDDVQNDRSGFFSLILATNGGYTATLKSTGKNYPTSGKLSSEGKATNTVPRTGTNAVTVFWMLDPTDSDRITGVVSNATWTAPLLGDRAVFNATNPAPQAGRYTLIIPGIPGATTSPEGDGYGTVVVNSSGVVTFSGTLADGTAAPQTTSISKNGDWPLYSSLYSGRGSLLGWMSFDTTHTNSDVAGMLNWIRPRMATLLYPAGFNVGSDSIGSRYVAPVGTNKVLRITNGVVTVTGGNLPHAFANPVTMGPSSHITNNSTNTVTMSFTLSSGLFTGTFKEKGTLKTSTFKGAVLQKANDASGYFLGTNQSGRVVLEPATFPGGGEQ